MNTVWVVRTPYTAEQVSTYSRAMNYFMDRAQEMGIRLTWRKGRGRVDDKGPRYHFWEIDNEQDAHAFYLACGDEIKNQLARPE
jgi:hypothetical protein